LNVMRDQIGQQRFDSLQELAALRIGQNESPHFLIFSRIRTQTRHEMRIRQESHIKHEIAVTRQSILVTKAHQRNQQWPLVRTAKALRDEVPQLMNIELRGINRYVRKPANRLHQVALV